MNQALDTIFTEGLQGAIPESALTVSAWAERYRIVSPERSARPGKWSNEVVPFLVGVMDAVTEPGVREVVFMKSSQVAGSEFGNNTIGYFMHIDPSTIQYVCENEGKAQAWSVESLTPMLRDTPVLAALLNSQAKQRDSHNKIEAKSFRGGHLAIGWASSPATLSSRPRRIVVFDECDAFEPTKEGDPIALGEARTKTFGDSKKIIKISSPRNKETSTIEPAYENSDKRKFYLPCPHCDEYQVLEWASVKWDDDPLFAYYVCVHGCIIEHDDKEEMLSRGEWRAEKEFRGIAGFWINELYSPFSSWGEMAEAFVTAKKSRETLKVFVNTRLAQTWEENGQQVEYADISFKCEDYKEVEVPDGVLVLTAGVDVQGDRLECEVIGWGADDESWSLDYRVFHGDPAQKLVWDDLKEHLTRDWTNEENEVFRIKAACIDSGGHHTQEVYNFARANAARRFYAIKGANTPGKPLVSKSSIVGAQKVKLWTIGTETAKDTIFANLKLDEHGPGYCHFPDDREESYFKQLCAEKQITKYVSSRPVKVWVKVSEGARNEALDCRVYGLAALGILKAHIKDLLKRKRTASPMGDVSQDVEQTETEETTGETTERQRVRIRRNNSFVNGGGSRGGFARGW